MSRLRLFLLLPGLLLGSLAAHAQGNDGPRQLGAPPSVPSAPRPRPASPRQLDQLPAPAKTDTARRAAAPAVPAPPPLGAPGTPVNPDDLRPTRFQVGLKNGTVYSARDVEQRSPLFGRAFLLLDGRQKVDFDEVRFYEDETGHYVRTTLPGSSREATLHRDRVGRLSLYSITSTQYSPGYGGLGYGTYGMPYGGYRTVRTEYFSKDNGPIQNLNLRNLSAATTDHAGTQQLLAQAHHYQTVSTASYVVGGALLLGGILQSVRPQSGQFNVSPLVYAALPVLVVPIVFQSKQAQAQRQAIALYNE